MSRSLDDLFIRLNKLYFSGKQTLVLDLLHDEVKKVANGYFKPNQSYEDQDQFFDEFNEMWIDLLRRQRYEEAREIWKFVLDLASEWENNNKPNEIHKGTPYYCLGVTAILNNKLEDGFLFMHQALEEDKRTHHSKTPKTPAYFFVTLDYEQEQLSQYFIPRVKEIAQCLFERMEKYRTTRKGALDKNTFKTKFLECIDLSEEVFLFVYVLFKLKKLLDPIETPSALRQNVFSSLLHAKSLFDICLVVEKVVEYKNPNSKKKGVKLKFTDELKFLSKETSLSLGKKKIRKLNDDFGDNFSGTLSNIIESKYPLLSKRIEEDLAIAYGIRNFAAHKLEDEPVLYEKVEELSQRLLNTLFFSIEKLYC